ncbi:uncharacterized protein LOC111077809 [Drosophila obscura]|uniref:uncharacterized protein LOC111077809 n=1 Tax=Drosophila obscura TaxID=7282 RepID=UPI000BA05119|nr:uncharacterized protein LOC111077809 [Drosophila obscura]
MADRFGTKEAFDGLSRDSAYYQIGVGAAIGFFIGYIFVKATKTVAIAVGGSLLIMQLALQSELIKFDALATILLHGNKRNSQYVHFVPTVAKADTIHILMEQLAKAYDEIAGNRRLCVAMIGGYLLGYGLA